MKVSRAASRIVLRIASLRCSVSEEEFMNSIHNMKLVGRYQYVHTQPDSKQRSGMRLLSRRRILSRVCCLTNESCDYENNHFRFNWVAVSGMWVDDIVNRRI